MDDTTIQHYDRQATELCQRYETADMSGLHRILLRHLPEHGTVLEIGTGSGRDAAFLQAQGFEVTGTDAAPQMVAAAAQCHPELAGRLVCVPFPFPAATPVLARAFDAIISIATLMHIPDQDLFEAASQLRTLVRPHGILVLSMSTGRDGLQDSRDPQGRLFVERPAEEIQLLFERVGFRLVARHTNQDSFARQVQWDTLVLERVSGSATRPIDALETIITRDRKNATYKLALLRALCEIAQTAPHQARWRHDGTVAVPLSLVAEKWLLYYWPLIELDQPDGRVVIPQKRGLEINKPIAFRRSMRDLIGFYRPHGGLSALYQDYKAGTVPVAGAKLLDQAINQIATTIVVGPVQFAGGALKDQGSFFGFDGKSRAKGRCGNPEGAAAGLGWILVPAGAWREMCLIGHWVGESLILRWAELTHEISDKTVLVKDVVDRLLVRPETDRDVGYARAVYGALPSLACTWTGERLGKQFAVDHAVPFSILHSNDLWNLLPATMKVNGQKSDRLATKEVLLGSRDRIVHCWEVMRGASPARFDLEAGRALAPRLDPANWQAPVFSGLVEVVETLAIQRGLERWPEGQECL